MPCMQFADHTFSGRRKKRSVLLPFPDRRWATKADRGHPIPALSEETERAAIEKSERAYRCPHFMKPRSGGPRLIPGAHEKNPNLRPQAGIKRIRY